jgi:hypothetical protein
MKTRIIFVLLITFLIGCKTEPKEKITAEVFVFNLKNMNERLKIDFQKLELDKNHPNLLNPSISKDSIKSVYASWTKLHQDLNIFLKKKNFDWGIEDEKIKLFNKIYFTENGQIKIYAYNIFNEVTEEKARMYGELVKEFSKGIRISVERDFDFAQCGKIVFPNLKKL